jgi:hypothetical protein
MKHIWPVKIGNEFSTASNKAPVFNWTARGRKKFIFLLNHESSP